MPTTQLAVVAAEHNVFADEVDMVLAPSAAGQLGILPRPRAPPDPAGARDPAHSTGRFRAPARRRCGFLEADQTHITALVNSAEWQRK